MACAGHPGRFQQPDTFLLLITFGGTGGSPVFGWLARSPSPPIHSLYRTFTLPIAINDRSGELRYSGAIRSAIGRYAGAPVRNRHVWSPKESRSAPAQRHPLRPRPGHDGDRRLFDRILSGSGLRESERIVHSPRSQNPRAGQEPRSFASLREGRSFSRTSTREAVP